MSAQKFDVFLCHNSEDKPAVITIAEQLQEQGVKPWLDVWELQPGVVWQTALEQQIENIEAVAVFTGKKGLGPWQEEEVRACLQEFILRKCPVIPVLLSDAEAQPQLPLFLRNRHWVDFRIQSPDPLVQLVWGITGRRPQRITSSRSSGLVQLTAIPAQDVLPPVFTHYIQLERYLQQGDWKKANTETYSLMLAELKKQFGGWFTQEEMMSFPLEPLETIDNLWVKHSEGKYGFSVQRELYVTCGGVLDGRYHGDVWDELCERVGWKDNGKWTSVVFDDSAKRGHLPILSGAFDTIETGGISVKATTLWSGICPALLSHPVLNDRWMTL